MADALGGGARQGALTEAQISDELGPNYDIPAPMRRARATISWWQVSGPQAGPQQLAAARKRSAGRHRPRAQLAIVAALAG